MPLAKKQQMEKVTQKQKKKQQQQQNRKSIAACPHPLCYPPSDAICFLNRAHASLTLRQWPRSPPRRAHP
jgi:hypothetical protein